MNSNRIPVEGLNKCIVAGGLQLNLNLTSGFDEGYFACLWVSISSVQDSNKEYPVMGKLGIISPVGKVPVSVARKIEGWLSTTDYEDRFRSKVRREIYSLLAQSANYQ